MTNLNKQTSSSELTPAGDAEVIKYLEQAIAGGKHWYIALLEAMKLWTIPEETYNGQTYRYLIDGEAFDWLRLAERLCEAIDNLIPQDEKNALIFQNKPPLDLPAEEFRELIGSIKYHQYLNYFYGITVEEALILAVEEEVRKERFSLGYHRHRDVTNEAYQRIYGDTQTALLRHFQREKHYPRLKSINFGELKEFTYWLFKYRLKHCEKARVASDTKKALNWLKSNGISGQLEKDSFKEEFIEILPS